MPRIHKFQSLKNPIVMHSMETSSLRAIGLLKKLLALRATIDPISALGSCDGGLLSRHI